MKTPTSHSFPEARRDFLRSQPHDFDSIDFEMEEAAASDPIHDHLPQTRSSRGAGRLFAILDELDQRDEQGGSR